MLFLLPRNCIHDEKRFSKNSNLPNSGFFEALAVRNRYSGRLVAAGIVDGVSSRTSGVPTNTDDLQPGWPQPSGESPRGDRARFVQHAVKR